MFLFPMRHRRKRRPKPSWNSPCSVTELCGCRSFKPLKHASCCSMDATCQAEMLGFFSTHSTANSSKTHGIEGEGCKIALPHKSFFSSSTDYISDSIGPNKQAQNTPLTLHDEHHRHAPKQQHNKPTKGTLRMIRVVQNKCSTPSATTRREGHVRK